MPETNVRRSITGSLRLPRKPGDDHDVDLNELGDQQPGRVDRAHGALLSYWPKV